MTTFEADSVITCPQCGYAKREAMPTDACQFYYECEGCKALLRPKPGDCCVFCSFGSARCPPMQMQSSDPGQPRSCKPA
ncbi:MAG TPA: GDCCVxC domain-containing (seleno)protein [Casimicrobiaceae bacterium]|nr:GDCCVxC domain-containing (seleno)protein [Casimicrobiaceae bacterium]